MKLFKSFKRKKKYNRVGPKMYWSYSKRKDRKRLKKFNCVMKYDEKHSDITWIY